jgi:hypothetical protein
MSSAGSSSSTLFNRRTRTFTPVSLIAETIAAAMPAASSPSDSHTSTFVGYSRMHRTCVLDFPHSNCYVMRRKPGGTGVDAAPAYIVITM